MTDAAIKESIHVYAYFGAGCSMIMFMRALLLGWHKPVTANFSALVLFAIFTVEIGSIMIGVHSPKAFGLCGPMVILTLWSCYYCTRELVKAVPVLPKEVKS